MLGDQALAAAKGLLFPSTSHTGGINLVIWTAKLDSGDRLEVYRGDMLPKNRNSWT